MLSEPKNSWILQMKLVSFFRKHTAHFVQHRLLHDIACLASIAFTIEWWYYPTVITTSLLVLRLILTFIYSIQLNIVGILNRIYQKEPKLKKLLLTAFWIRRYQDKTYPIYINGQPIIIYKKKEIANEENQHQ